ncbi:MAG TPA: chemotaxis protein CheD [Symbiobacteriaceae bacterium]|nr:chemotaxis protein CheD [Symbiobacteriaceae bacterium]
MNEPMAVGLGELKGSRDPEAQLVCYGLGSCIGLALWDLRSRVGAMAHIVLPDSALSRGPVVQPAKWADTALPAALELMAGMGASRTTTVARIAGGARMLNVVGAGSRLDIGARNIEAVREVLRRHDMRLTAEDVAGTWGRTLTLHVGTGRLVVSTAGRGEQEL